jgi:uracil-DNA glycosylase family 4
MDNSGKLFNIDELYEAQDDSEYTINQAAHTQNMLPAGENRERILCVGEAPSVEDDKAGKPFVEDGKSGELLRAVCGEIGIDVDRDMLLTHVITTHPLRGKFPKWGDIGWYLKQLTNLIDETQPKLIVCLGARAARAVLDPNYSLVNMTMYRARGRLIPRGNSWVGCTYHPSYINRMGGLDSEYGAHFVKDVAKYCLSTPSPPRIVEPGDIIHDCDFDKMAEEFLREENWPIAYDLETTGLIPGQDHIICVSYCGAKTSAYVTMLDTPEAHHFYDWFINSKIPKIIHNAQFENSWSLEQFGNSVADVVWDTQLVEHGLDSRKDIKGNTALETVTFLRFNRYYKGLVNRKSMSTTERLKLITYSGKDAWYTQGAYQLQKKDAQTRNMMNGAKLLTEGQMLLSTYTHNGVGVDLDEAHRRRIELEHERAAISTEINNNDIVKRWRRNRGNVFRPDSDALSDLLYTFTGCPVLKETKKGPSVDKATLTELKEENIPEEAVSLIDNVLEFRASSKTYGTYILPLIAQAGKDGIVHPRYRQDKARSYRSSSYDPNIQNPPKSDYRSVFVPKLDVFLDVDYKQLEVCIIAMYTQDPVLLEWLKEGIDMHTFWAAYVYDVPESEITEEVRSRTKNNFVFALFYGAGINRVATGMGIPYAVARRKVAGFWNVLKGVKRWQDNLVAKYEANGYVEMELGFRRPAPIDYNQLINTPIQGTAYHRLLRAAINIERRLHGLGLHSHGVAEIHDELLIDCKESELEQVYDIVVDEMIDQQPKSDPIRLAISASIGTNWWEQVKYER